MANDIPCAPCEAAKKAREASLAALKDRSAELTSPDGTLKIIYKTIGGARVLCGKVEYMFLRNRLANADMIAIDVLQECAENYVASNRARFPSAKELETLAQYEAQRNKVASAARPVAPPPAKKKAAPAAKPAAKAKAPKPAPAKKVDTLVHPKDLGGHVDHSPVAPKESPDNLT